MPIELYHFRPRWELTLAPWEAEALLAGEPASVNLGRDRVDRVEASGNDVTVYTIGGVYMLPRERLREAAGDRYAWYLWRGKLWRAVLSGRGFKALEPTPSGPPTLWIDGIHMHRVKATSPLADARAKVRAAGVRRGDRVLDVCTGLGYTAIASLERGASMVVTIEVDSEVLYLAAANPWSSGLEDPRVTIIHGDALDVVGELSSGFDRIIHDPPRFSSKTGNLYSLDFYRALYGLLRPSGALFHYTGEPGRGRRVNLPGSVSSRLARAGFIVKGYDRRSLGVVAYKPRSGG